jgi:ABC-type multidrug transport system ATPase subunit
MNGVAGPAPRGYCPAVSSWGHVEVAHVSHVLPDGRILLDDVSFRVGEGITAALVGPNGAGKTTLLRLVAGDLQPQSGSAARRPDRQAGRDLREPDADR